MKPNSTLFAPHNPLASPLAPYPSRNIRLSSALWAMQFLPRTESEPATFVVDFETKQPIVTFWHEHTLPPEASVAVTFAAMDKMLTATHVGMWWAEPANTLSRGMTTPFWPCDAYTRRVSGLSGSLKGGIRSPGTAGGKKDPSRRNLYTLLRRLWLARYGLWRLTAGHLSSLQRPVRSPL
jgi:hypothetical protein